jgi:hypothetical protein
MSSVFDQFDAQPAQPSPGPMLNSGGNVFDQFDVGTTKPSLRPMTQDEETQFLANAKASGATNQATIPEAATAVGNRLNAGVRGAADIMSFGTADRIAAGLGSVTGIGGNPGDYAGNLAAQRQADQTDPNARLVGQGLGALAYPAKAASLAGSAGLSALQGFLYGIGSSPDYTNIPQVAKNAAIGTAVGGVAGGIGQIGARSAGRLLEAPLAADTVPTVANIEDLKNAAYAKADQLGAAYTPEAYGGLIDKIASDAKAANISSEIHPAASSVINNLQLDAKARAVTGEPISLTQLDQVRQMVGRDVASSSVKGERYFGKQITGNIDNFISKSGADEMAAGAAPEAASAIQTARDLNTRYMKTQAVQEAIEKAAGSANISGNLDNKIRTRLNALFQKSGNWTPEEQAAFQKVNEQTPVQNLIKMAATFSPDNMFKKMIEFGAAPVVAGPAALAVPLAGYAAKKIAGSQVQGNIRQLAETILAGPGGTAVTPFGKFPRTRAGARALAAAMTARAVSESQ